MNHDETEHAGEGAVTVHASLQHAFATRADGVDPQGRALVGTFGEGIPRPLIAALGALAVDVKAPPLTDASEGPTVRAVTAVTEPFLDSFTARFLHRFAAGAFDRFATLVFARDDVAGLAAYQYATELRRQGVLSGGPRLHLANLLHTDSPAVTAFNRAELARLTAHLVETLATPLDPGQHAQAMAAETRRTTALHALSKGTVAFVTLNAGRWLDPKTHAALLEPQDLTAVHGPTIALTGTACDIPVLHHLCAGRGTVIADLQDYGRPQPQPATPDDLTPLLDPLAPRAAPPRRFTQALHAGIAGADLVIASVNVNDDSFGWELPGLRAATEAQGARFLDLGFRPFRPDAAWQDHARAAIERALS